MTLRYIKVKIINENNIFKNLNVKMGLLDNGFVFNTCSNFTIVWVKSCNSYFQYNIFFIKIFWITIIIIIILCIEQIDKCFFFIIIIIIMQ